MHIITFKFYVQVPLVYISSLVLTFLNIWYVCTGVFYFLFFFKVNSGVFLHNRVATQPKMA